MFYGDNNRWFVATVKENDPEKRGRYKIRIHGLHSTDVEDTSSSIHWVRTRRNATPSYTIESGNKTRGE